MVNRYETVFILNSVLSDDQVKKTVDSYRKLLKKLKTKVIFEDDWGLQKLAYPIKNKNSGYYFLFEFESDGNVIQDMELAFRRDESVLRYLTVKLDKHAVEYNESRKNRNDQKEPQKETKEKVEA